MNQEEAKEIMAKCAAVITESHVVYTSDKHGSAYVNKDAIYPHTEAIAELCKAIAEEFAESDVDVVISPAIGGVILSQWTANHLTQITGREVMGTYAERDEKSLLKGEKGLLVQIIESVAEPSHIMDIEIGEGEELVLKKRGFVIKRGYDKLVVGKRVLVVEDVLTTGGSVRKVIEATRSAGGDVVGLGVLCNRGGVTLQDVANPPKLFALVNVTLDAWDEADCLLCARGVPINTEVGKGKQYLERKVAG